MIEANKSITLCKVYIVKRNNNDALFPVFVEFDY